MAGSPRRWGFDCQVLSDQERVPQLGTHYYTTAFGVRPRAFVQPAALIRVLAASPPTNMTLPQRTLVTREGADPSNPLREEHVHGDRPCIANNAQAGDLGILPDRIVTILTYAALTPRLEENDLANLGAAPLWGRHLSTFWK